MFLNFYKKCNNLCRFDEKITEYQISFHKSMDFVHFFNWTANNCIVSRDFVWSTYIFMVPFGPKLVFITSCRPFEAEILMANAWAARADSAFGFNKLIEDILTISNQVYQIYFQSKNNEHEYSRCSTRLYGLNVFCHIGFETEWSWLLDLIQGLLTLRTFQWILWFLQNKLKIQFFFEFFVFLTKFNDHFFVET